MRDPLPAVVAKAQLGRGPELQIQLQSDDIRPTVQPDRPEADGAAIGAIAHGGQCCVSRGAYNGLR